jgi:hypothetical protein
MAEKNFFKELESSHFLRFPWKNGGLKNVYYMTIVVPILSIDSYKILCTSLIAAALIYLSGLTSTVFEPQPNHFLSWDHMNNTIYHSAVNTARGPVVSCAIETSLSFNTSLHFHLFLLLLSLENETAVAP